MIAEVPLLMFLAVTCWGDAQATVWHRGIAVSD